MSTFIWTRPLVSIVVSLVLSILCTIASYYNKIKHAAIPKVYYTIHGDIHNNNGILFFLHGFPDFEYLWSSQVQFFTASNKNYCCITLEIPNFNINRMQNPWGYSILKVVNALGNTIKNVLPKNKECVLIAHDWGAFLSQLVYINFKKKISFTKLILLDVGDGYDTDPKELHKYSYQLVCGLAFLLPTSIGTWYLRKYLQNKLRLGDTQNRVIFPIFNLEKRDHRSYFHSTSAYLYYNAVVKSMIFDSNNDVLVTPQLNEFEGLPILFISGVKGNDPTRFYTKQFKEFINKRDYCKWVEFDCFHWIMDEQVGLAKKCNQTLYQFIRK